MKLRWKVADRPTGRYRSFSHWGWPIAFLPNGDCAVALYCEDDYLPAKVREGAHAEIKVCIADYRTDKNEGAFKWRTLQVRTKTLEQAKTLAQNFINAHPEVVTRPAK